MDLELPAVGRVLVLAVDDEPTANAAAIRSTTTRTLRPTLERFFGEGLTGLATDWLRSDLRVVIVHPSSPGSSRAVGPSDDPTLALVTENASFADVAALADSAARAIESAVANAQAPYPLMEATAQTVDLLARARPPEDAREASLVASIGNPEEMAVIIATSRDDASPGSVENYAWWTSLSPIVLAYSTVFSSLSASGGGGACVDALVPSTRLETWVDVARRAGVFVEVFGAQCDKILQQFGFDAVIGDGGGWCLPASPAARADGSPACLVTATFRDDASCASRPGMLDPMDPDGVRRPHDGDADAGWAGRVCEVSELEGSAATACSEAAACTGCTAGWCATRMFGSPQCDQATLRFVHGGVPRGPALLHVVCDVAP